MRVTINLLLATSLTSVSVGILDQFVHRDGHDHPEPSECDGNLMEYGVFRIGDKIVAHHCPSHADGTPRYCPQLDPGLYHIGDITEHHRYRYLPMECGSP